MTIPFHCPHCGHQSDIDESYAGSEGPCASCGEIITIPGGRAFAEPPMGGSGTGMILVLAGAVVLGGIVVCGGLLGILSWKRSTSPSYSPHDVCRTNLKHIALAMHNYHADYGSFPPAFIADEDGKPKHSWRVLLLPYMEYGPLYDQYNFDEPWDSPANLALARHMPSVYSCPASSDTAPYTNYMVIVGPDTIFPSDGSAVALRQILDGSSETLMVVEVEEAGVNWMEPKDLDATKMMYSIHGGPGEMGSGHVNGIMNAAFADAHVTGITPAIAPQMLKAMTTIDGGEAVAEPN